MRYQDFASSPTGRLVPTILGEKAYLPAPLPPSFDMAAVALSLAEAKMAVGELRGVSRSLANPYLLISPLQRREALTSSAIEGTYTTADALVIAEAGVDSRDPDTVEVQNYISALRYALQALETIPISHRMIRETHRILMTDTVFGRGANKRPGEYKTEQNWIGGRTLETARFIPPPPNESLACMDALEAWINRADRVGSDPLIDIALAHYQFETIHPFADGNGRVGRLLITLMSVSTGMVSKPILYLSPAIERRKEEYVDLMYAVSAKGHWEDWVRFLCEIVSESCIQTIQTIDQFTAIRTRMTDRVRSKSNSANDLAVLDLLFEQPVVRLTAIRKRLDLTPQGARNVVNRLIATEIIKELPDYYPKLFYSPEILTISDR